MARRDVAHDISVIATPGSNVGHRASFLPAAARGVASNPGTEFGVADRITLRWARRAMTIRFSTIAFLLLLIVLAAFVWRTSQALPPIVASHFSASGAANGFMPRGTYTTLVVVLVVGAPLLLALVPAAAAGREAKNLKIPDREHWLAQERREASIACIRGHGQWFAAAVALFLTYVHWLVVRANALHPPVLSIASIVSGLVVFFLALAVWVAVLFRRFRRRV